MKKLVLAMIVLLAGCKAASSSPTLATAPPSTTSTTSLAEGYRQQYLDLVAGGNCAGSQLYKAEQSLRDAKGYIYPRQWAAVQAQVLPAYKAWADAVITQFQGFAAATWPANAQDDVRILVRLSTAIANAANKVATSKTWDDFVANENSQPDDGTSQAAAVRAILGLPTNLVDNDTFDWCQGPPRAASLVPSTTTAPTPTTTAT